MRSLLLVLVVSLQAAIASARPSGHPAPSIFPPFIIPRTAPGPSVTPPFPIQTPAPAVPSQASSAGTPESQVALDLSDPDIKKAYKDWTIAFIGRQMDTLREDKAAFATAGTMGVIVCWVVHIFLAWAIIASMIEFWRALKTQRQASKTQELNVSLQGIALKTSLHGTLLLVIAMVFYYLFLKIVYPITIVGT